MSNIAINCTTRTGQNDIYEPGDIDKVSCRSDETLVSCGVWTQQGPLEGTWIDNNTCNAWSSMASTQATRAKARCCRFPSDANIAVSTRTSVNGSFVKASCSSDSVLTGCHHYHDSGPYANLRGAYTGPYPFNTTAWISTLNQCHSKSNAHTNGSVKVDATCLALDSSYTLTCETKSALVNSINPTLACRSGYSMMGCNAFTDNRAIDAWTIDFYYITENDTCHVQQDYIKPMYANIICCVLNVTNKQTSSTAKIIAVIFFCLFILCIIVIHVVNKRRTLKKRKDVLDHLDENNIIMTMAPENCEAPGAQTVVNITDNGDTVEHKEMKKEQNVENKTMLKSWLTDAVGLTIYYETFIQNGYESVEFIQEVKDESELEDIGIENVAHRKQIMIEIYKLKQNKLQNLVNSMMKTRSGEGSVEGPIPIANASTIMKTDIEGS